MIFSFFLKPGIEILAPSLVNTTVQLVPVCPENWMTARVVPIFKQGSTDDKSNYRAIISNYEMYTYFNEKKLILSDQSGFQKLCSCARIIGTLIRASLRQRFLLTSKKL